MTGNHDADSRLAPLLARADFNPSMHRNPIALTLGLAAATVVGVGQVPLSSITSGFYTQNFDSLAASGTSVTWTDNVTLPGWYLSRGTYLVGTGSASAGGAYSFGSVGSPDRALGSVAIPAGGSATGNIIYSIRFVNDTAQVFERFNVRYTGEQWRHTVTALQHSLRFSYDIKDVPFLSETDGAFTEVSSLEFVGPKSGAASSGSINGNLPINQVSLEFGLTFGETLDPGEEIMLRWLDTADLNANHGLAIDNLSIEIPEASPAIPASAAVGVGIMLLARRLKR